MKHKRASRGILASFTLRGAVALICLIWTIPTIGLLISSFRELNHIMTSGWWTVFRTPLDFSQYTLENYRRVISAHGLGNAFLNSVTATVPSTLIPITVAAFAAYALAWMRFPGRDMLFTLIVWLIVIPLQMTLIPLLRIYVALKLSGTFPGIWLAHTGFGIPLAVYLLYSFISQIPRELIEAATVDGASHFQIFTQVVLRLSTPAIASFAVFQFLWVWNDLLVSLVFLGTSQDVATMTVVLTELVGTRGQDWHLLTSGAFVSMAVPLLVFFSLQRYFVRGILAGSVKG
ncbi:MAG: carbohydrate ABC transporter permease [Anaerolineae bacterium]|nr:carbohydrate ABC transporter permease [Anaerolineae bacterium]